jgi:hypothetical protein
VYLSINKNKKRREFNPETHMAFLDLEKAFDRVNRNQLW